MICPNCGSKHSYCEYGVEICRRCGRKQEARSELLPGVSTYVLERYRSVLVGE